MTEHKQNTEAKTPHDGSASELSGLVMRYHWLPGWYASKLHAIKVGTDLPKGMATVQSECGQRVYGKAPTEWAQRRVDKGVPKCKKCLKRVSA